MSFVLSRFFNHKDDRGIEKQLKSYAVDDKFHLQMTQHGKYGGTTWISMEFSVTEAMDLRAQLTEFIAQRR